jgi:hypothetical protein
MNILSNNHHYFYLLLSIVGGGITFYFAMLGVLEHHGQFDTTEFITSTWIDNYYAKSLTLDFWTGAIAGTFFIIVEGIRLKIKRIWLYPVLTVFVAFAFGFPLFLFVRALYLKQQQ